MKPKTVTLLYHGKTALTKATDDTITVFRQWNDATLDADNAQAMKQAALSEIEAHRRAMVVSGVNLEPYAKAGTERLRALNALEAAGYTRESATNVLSDLYFCVEKDVPFKFNHLRAYTPEGKPRGKSKGKGGRSRTVEKAGSQFSLNYTHGKTTADKCADALAQLGAFIVSNLPKEPKGEQARLQSLAAWLKDAKTFDEPGEPQNGV